MAIHEGLVRARDRSEQLRARMEEQLEVVAALSNPPTPAATPSRDRTDEAGTTTPPPRRDMPATEEEDAEPEPEPEPQARRARGSPTRAEPDAELSSRLAAAEASSGAWRTRCEEEQQESAKLRARIEELEASMAAMAAEVTAQKAASEKPAEAVMRRAASAPAETLIRRNSSAAAGNEAEAALRRTLNACEEEPVGVIAKAIASASLASVRMLNAFLSPASSEAELPKDAGRGSEAETPNDPGEDADVADEGGNGGDAVKDGETKEYEV